MQLPDFDPSSDHPLWDLANMPSLGSETYMCRDWLLTSATYLMSCSDRHSGWTEEDVIRLIYPPILCDQALFMFAPNPVTGKNQPRGFMTWAWLSPEAEKSYLSGSRKLQPFDYVKTSPEDVLWVIDLVAPFGSWDVRWLCRRGQDYLSPICLQNGLKGIKMRRGSRRTGFFYAHNRRES